LTVTIAVLVAALIGFGAGWVANGDSASEQTVQQQIAETLRTEVHNGMTVDDISRLVGPDMIETNYKIPDSLRDHMHRLLKERGSAVQPEDSFCAIRIGNNVYMLHFRDSKLINCDPEADFGDPGTMIAGIPG
jgi:hypothetical protein